MTKIRVVKCVVYCILNLHKKSHLTTDPLVTSESNPDADLVVEAGVPVNADDHVDDELQDAKDVRVVGA